MRTWGWPARYAGLGVVAAMLAGTAMILSSMGSSASAGTVVTVDARQDVSPALSVLAGAPHEDLSHQTAAGTATKRMSAPVVSFNGMSLGPISVGAPTDDNGEIGKSAYVQSMNTQYAVFSRSGKLLLGPVKTNTLWKGFGGPCETHNDGDPVVVYDQLADRWVQTQFAAPDQPPFYQCVAVSKTGDPTGAWYRYAFANKTYWNDYAKLSVWPDGYYLSADLENGIVGGSGGPAAMVFERNQMLQGKPARMIFKHVPNSASAPQLLPADLDGTRLPPSGAPDTFAGVDEPSHSVWLYHVHVDWTNTAKSAVTGPIKLAAKSYSLALDNCDQCAPQPGTSTKLATNPGYSMFRLAYRNFGDHESIVFNHTIDVDPSSRIQPGVRWYEIRNVSTTPTLYQQGTFAPDTDSRFDGSAAMDKFGNIALGYTVSGSHTYPSIRYAGRLAADPLGQLPQGEQTLMAGSGSQLAPRWGDYSDMTVDPIDDCTFWYTNVYLTMTGNTRSSRIGAFRFPGCGAAK